jgi:hypothetical protein
VGPDAPTPGSSPPREGTSRAHAAGRRGGPGETARCCHRGAAAGLLPASPEPAKAKGARVASDALQLRIGSRLLTRSQRSRRDGFSLLALAQKCERLRIQVVARAEPGRSLGFALSRRGWGRRSKRARFESRMGRQVPKRGVAASDGSGPSRSPARFRARGGSEDKTTSLFSGLKAICLRGHESLRA